MDPNQTLAELRAYLETAKEDTDWDPCQILDEVMSRFEALDEWLTKGGFWPEAWAGERKVPA